MGQPSLPAYPNGDIRNRFLTIPDHPSRFTLHVTDHSVTKHKANSLTPTELAKFDFGIGGRHCLKKTASTESGCQLEMVLINTSFERGELKPCGYP